VDLAPGGASTSLGLAHSPTRCAFHLARNVPLVSWFGSWKTGAPRSFPLTFDTPSVHYLSGKPAQSFRAIHLAYGFPGAVRDPSARATGDRFIALPAILLESTHLDNLVSVETK
jgi:hypothetical protein